MEEQKKLEKELTKKLKRKKLRKYCLIVLALAVIAYTASIFTVESKDAMLADGQGNVIDYQQEAEESKAEKEKVKKEKGEEKEKTEKTAEENVTAKEERKDPQGKTAEELKVDNSKDPTASNKGNAEYRPDEAKPVTVTVSIRCDTLADDMSKLENPAIEEYIPEDGCILGTTTYMGTTENTVYDVLNTVCRNNGIQLEASFAPVYESYYVEGINYLYEFDAGNQSGWKYRVNGWFPNYGCSSYYLSDGDVIEWVYTCNLGKDVGAGSIGY